jgi:hypothetical protein
LVFGRKAVVVVGEQWEMKIKRVIMRALALWTPKAFDGIRFPT